MDTKYNNLERLEECLAGSFTRNTVKPSGRKRFPTISIEPFMNLMLFMGISFCSIRWVDQGHRRYTIGPKTFDAVTRDRSKSARAVGCSSQLGAHKRCDLPYLHVPHCIC